MRPDSTLVTLALAAILALAISLTAAYLPQWDASTEPGGTTVASVAGESVAKADTAAVWAASAPGRIKPKGGEIGIVPEAQGVLTAVHAKVNDTVQAGDPIAVIKDDDAIARLAAARAEVRVRLAERDEEPEKNKAMVTWREAQDKLAAAERELHNAQVSFDRVYFDKANGGSGDVDGARKKIAAARAKVADMREALRMVEAQPDLPPATRLDSGLKISRSDLKLAEIAFDKTRIRATTAGTVLDIDAKVGEMASPSRTTPVAVIGDVSQLEVTAEVEERDIQRIAIGQHVIIRSNAFEGKDFSGKVVRMAPRVGRPGLGLRNSSQPRDVEILEVEIELDDAPQLLSGMRVDVFFKPRGETKAADARN
jgi:HlyD family secretion protein